MNDKSIPRPPNLAKGLFNPPIQKPNENDEIFELAFALNVSRFSLKSADSFGLQGNYNQNDIRVVPIIPELLIGDSPPLDAPACQRLNSSTPQQLNPSTPQPYSHSPPQLNSPTSPSSLIYESQFIPLEEARRRIRLQAGLEESLEVQAPFFIGLTDALDKHRDLPSSHPLYLEITGGGPLSPSPAKLRVIVTGPEGSGSAQLIESLSRHRFTSRKKQLRHGLSVTLCGLKRPQGPGVELQFIETPWPGAAVKGVLQRGLKEAVARKGERLTGGEVNKTPQGIHMVIFCMKEGKLSEADMVGLKEIEDLVALVPVRVGEVAKSELCDVQKDGERFKKSPESSKRPDRGRKYSEQLKDPEPSPSSRKLSEQIRQSCEGEPLGVKGAEGEASETQKVSWMKGTRGDRPFYVVPGDSYVVGREGRFLARGGGTKPLNVSDPAVSDLEELFAFLVGPGAETARILAEERVDRKLREQNELFGVRKGIMAGVVLGVGATLAAFGLGKLKG